MHYLQSISTFVKKTSNIYFYELIQLAETDKWLINDSSMKQKTQLLYLNWSIQAKNTNVFWTSWRVLQAWFQRLKTIRKDFLVAN
jgi:type II secretory pathway component PulL